MDKSELLERVSEIFSTEYPEYDLGNKQDPLDELVFISLCTNTGPQNVERAYNTLKKRFDSWEKVLQVPEGEVAVCVEKSGYKHEKEKLIREILNSVYADRRSFDLSFLNEMDDESVENWLMSIDGVGRKIAHCVMLFSLGRERLPVDTHVERILKRLGIADPVKKQEQVGEEIQGLIPEGHARLLHTNFVYHGRNICRAEYPKCEKCSISNLCAYAGHHVLETP